jgi:hypothetical protein
MKFILLFLVCFTFTNVSYCQTIVEVKQDTYNKADSIYFKVDENFSFPGGDSAWNDYLKSNLKIKVPADNGAAMGRYVVIVKFVVRKDGSAYDVRCENDPGYGMCEEAQRIIKKVENGYLQIRGELR